MSVRNLVKRYVAGVLFFSALATPCLACSVLSHEAVVDAAWDIKLEPLLRARYPAATAEELKTAHGFAYGGAIIQDLGYYPHGNKHFSDLTHYVRTGDFVMNLLAEAHDLNETAFALGALSHYASDINVHRFATNPGEAILYPRLRRKFGLFITYEQDPAAHLKTEFGFDVLEVTQGNFAPEAYHSFIGFGVTTPLLARAFEKTYGLELTDLFPDLERSMNSYRRAVSRTIPEATRMAWAQRESDIVKKRPGTTRSKFVYLMSQSSYEREWGKQYDRPTVKDRVAARTLQVLPPVGPLRALRFRMPNAQVEKLFTQSFDQSLTGFRAQLDAARSGTLHLENRNYDLGEVAKPGVYRLQDEAYEFWQDELEKRHFAAATGEIRESVREYFSKVPVERPRNGKTPVQQEAALKASKANSQLPHAGGG